MGIISRLISRELIFRTDNPYTGKPMDGTVAQIKGKWKDEYLTILNKKNVKHLFLNTALGWRCDNYDFLSCLDFLETLVVLEEGDISIKPVESLKHLRTLEINAPNHYNIDFSAFKCLESLSCSVENPIPSIFQCSSLKDLYLNEFKMEDKHQLSQLHNLESLTIGNSNISNIDFVQSMPNLKKFVILNNRKITDFSPISTIQKLNWLELRGVKNLHSIDFLENLKELNVLLLECGAIESIHPIQNHQELKAISLGNQKFSIDDGDLSPIETLNNLSMLFIPNKKSYNARVNNLWNWDNYGKARHDWIKRV